MNDPQLYEKVIPIENNFPVKFHFSTYHSKAGKIHWHEYTELLFCKDEDNRFFCNGTYHSAKKGELAVISPNDLHFVIYGEFYCMRISPVFFEDIFYDEMYFKTIIPKDKVIEECFENIYKELNGGRIGYDMEIKSMAYHLMCHLARNYRTGKEKKKTDHGFVGEVLTYISNNCYSKLSTKSIAEHFHLSENYFCNLFKSYVGTSPVDYINKFRIEKAAVLIKNTDKSITDISYHIGFEDSNYFSRVFKKYMGVSPREYRKVEKER